MITSNRIFSGGWTTSQMLLMSCSLITSSPSSSTILIANPSNNVEVGIFWWEGEGKAITAVIVTHCAAKLPILRAMAGRSPHHDEERSYSVDPHVPTLWMEDKTSSLRIRVIIWTLASDTIRNDGGHLISP